jgi:hypothetical protein
MAEKSASPPAWAEKVINEKENEDSVVAILKPKLVMLTHKSAIRPDACGDIPQGLYHIAASAPDVFAQTGVVKELLDLLKFSPGMNAPRDGLFQVHMTRPHAPPPDHAITRSGSVCPVADPREGSCKPDWVCISARYTLCSRR